MKTKEKAYKLYNLSCFESVAIDDKYVIRVPGGWIINAVFVPYDNEYQDFAFSTTNEKITLLCAGCKHVFETTSREKFQKQLYNCPNCNNEIKYEV